MTTTVYPIILTAADVARLSGRVAAMEVMREAFRSLGLGLEDVAMAHALQHLVQSDNDAKDPR